MTVDNEEDCKVLPYRIRSGNLCKVITAYGEPEMASLSLGSGTGKVTKTYIFASIAAPENKINTGFFVKKKPTTLYTNELVMFLKAFSPTESLVLLGQGYFIVPDKNLEPVVSAERAETVLISWLRKFEAEFKSHHFSQTK